MLLECCWATRVSLRYQSVVALPECCCATRVLLRYQSVVALPECCCVTRVLLRYQSVVALPECCCATRVLLRYQSVVALLECCCATRVWLRWMRSHHWWVIYENYPSVSDTFTFFPVSNNMYTVETAVKYHECHIQLFRLLLQPLWSFTKCLIDHST